MKSEKGLVHLLIAGEIVLLILIVVFGVVKQAKGPEESADYAISTEDNVIEEQPTETETETEVTETEYPGLVFSDEVEALLDNMTIEQQVAQLFIVSPETLTGADRATIAGDGTKTALGTYPVGGVIYARSNYLGRTQMRDLISGTQELSFEQNGQYLFVVTPVIVEETPMLAVAWNGAEDEMTELVRVEGNIRRASLGGLSLMSYLETEDQLIAAMGDDALRCVAIETNQLDAVTMLQSGADMLCVTEGFPEIYAAVLEAVEARTITETQIHDAAGRVLTQKAALSEQDVEE